MSEIRKIEENILKMKQVIIELEKILQLAKKAAYEKEKGKVK